MRLQIFWANASSFYKILYFYVSPIFNHGPFLNPLQTLGILMFPGGIEVELWLNPSHRASVL